MGFTSQDDLINQITTNGNTAASTTTRPRPWPASPDMDGPGNGHRLTTPAGCLRRHVADLVDTDDTYLAARSITAATSVPPPPSISSMPRHSVLPPPVRRGF